MTIEKIGLVTFALVFLCGFTWRASLLSHFYYMRWLDFVDMVDPEVEEEEFERRVRRFGRLLAGVSVASLLAIAGSVYWLAVEYGKLQEQGVGRSEELAEGGSVELELEKLGADRKRQLEVLLASYVAMIDARVRKISNEGDFATFVELNQERTYGLAIQKEAGLDVWKGRGLVNEVRLPPFAMLEVTTVGERLEMRRALTRAVGKVYEETGEAFWARLGGLGVEGGEAWVAARGRCGPLRVLLAGQPDLARTLSLTGK
jgi:hypothetical protein